MLNRDEFVKVLKEYGVTDLILDVFDYGSLHETETFILHNEPSGDVSIIDKTTLDSKPRVINWYKLSHIGRDLNIYGFNSWEEFVDTLHNIRDELKVYLPKIDEHYNENNIKEVDSKRVAKDIKKIQINSFYGSTVDVNSLYPVIIGARGSGKSHYESNVKRHFKLEGATEFAELLKVKILSMVWSPDEYTNDDYINCINETLNQYEVNTNER